MVAHGPRVGLHPEEGIVALVQRAIEEEAVEEVVRPRVIPPADVVLLRPAQVGIAGSLTSSTTRPLKPPLSLATV